MNGEMCVAQGHEGNGASAVVAIEENARETYGWRKALLLSRGERARGEVVAEEREGGRVGETRSSARLGWWEVERQVQQECVSGARRGGW